MSIYIYIGNRFNLDWIGMRTKNRSNSIKKKYFFSFRFVKLFVIQFGCNLHWIGLFDEHPSL